MNRVEQPAIRRSQTGHGDCAAQMNPPACGEAHRETGEVGCAPFDIDLLPAERFAGWRGRHCRCWKTKLAKQYRKDFARMHKALAEA